MSWDNKQKLTLMFTSFQANGEALPASGVNDQGDSIPNLSKLARLAKVIQGKQVFRTHFGQKLLKDAIENCSIESLNKGDETDETAKLRNHMQSSIDDASR